MCLGRPQSSHVFALERCRDVCKGVWCDCYIDCLIPSDDDEGEFDQCWNNCREEENPDLINQCDELCGGENITDPWEYFGECGSNYYNTTTPYITSPTTSAPTVNECDFEKLNDEMCYKSGDICQKMEGYCKLGCKSTEDHVCLPGVWSMKIAFSRLVPWLPKTKNDANVLHL